MFKVFFAAVMTMALTSCVHVAGVGATNLATDSGKKMTVSTSGVGLLALTTPSADDLEAAAIAKLKKKGAVKNVTTRQFRCHDLRHSFAYNYLLKGGNMYSLQQILGHKQIGLTVDLYGGLKARDLKEVSPYGF